MDFVSIVESSQNFTAIAQKNYTGNITNGDSFEYTSTVQDGSTPFPAVIQLNVYGKNDAGDDIVNVLAISYTQNCSAYPVFVEDFSLGWTNFVSCGDELCAPIAFSALFSSDVFAAIFVQMELEGPPTAACTAFDDLFSPVPSTIPTAAPIVETSPAPTSAPVGNVTMMPTLAPAVIESPSPTKAPVDIQTPEPTPIPVVETNGPTVAPIDESTPSPTDSSPSPSIAPASIETPSPIEISSEAPTRSPIEATVAPSEVTEAPAPDMSMSMDLEFSMPMMSMSMSMGMEQLDYFMLEMMEDLTDFGVRIPKAKEGKASRVVTKKGKKGKKGAKKGSSKHSKNSDGPKEAKKEGKTGNDGLPNESSSSKEAKRASKKDSYDDSVSFSTETKKNGKRDTKRRRRLRIHHVETS